MNKIIGISLAFAFFLGVLVIGIPLVIERIFWYTSNSIHTTWIVYAICLGFFLVIIGIIIPLVRKFLNYLKITKTNFLDSLATVLMVFVSGIPLVILCFITLTLLKIKVFSIYRYKIFNFAIKITLPLIGLFTKFFGKINKEARVMIFNHTSSADYFLACLAMGINPWNIVAGINLAKSKNTFWDKCIAWSIGDIVKKYSIAVDRSNDFSKSKTYRKANEEIQDGKNVAWFPEGGRILKTKILKDKVILGNFQDGAFKIAWNKKISIQPIVFDWPVIWRGKGEKWWGVHPCTIKVYFLDIIKPENYELFNDFKNTCWLVMEEQLRKSKNVKNFLK